MPHSMKKMISFFLTTRCNLCCRYCYNAKERNHLEEKSLPVHIACAGIDWYFNTNQSRHIRFYGPGEPTQEFDKLKAITEYAKSHPCGGENVTVEIQTNGIMHESVRDWMLDNVNIIWMSFDGMKDIQNYNRPLNPIYERAFNGKKSADILEDNVRWLIQHRGNRNLMVGARVTVTDSNVNKQIEMVDYFFELGIRYVWTDPLFHSVGRIPVCEDIAKLKSYHFDMDAYVENYIQAHRYAKVKGLFWGSFLIINFDGESPFHCRCCTPLEAPHLTPDGYISACDMVVLGAKAYHMNPFIVGKWDSNLNTFIFDYKKVIALNNRSSLNISHCVHCPVRFHCGGYCLGETLNETGKLDGQNKTKCGAIRHLYNKLGDFRPYPYLHP